MKKNRIKEMVEMRKNGIHTGIPSFCSANKIVIEAILEEAKKTGDYALIEDTSNQVNQFGGYMNMKSIDFRDYVYKIADKIDFDKSKIILGGDHLGPLPWVDEDEELAMNKAKQLVYECAGTDVTTKLCFCLAANKGNVCYIGTPKNDVTFTIKEWENINRKELKVTASWMSYSKPFPGDEWIRTNEELKKGNLKIFESMIHGIYKMEDASVAFEQFKGRIKGKVIIENEYY